jgi:hypothetical protein
MTTPAVQARPWAWARPALVVLVSLLAVASATAEGVSPGLRVVALLSFLVLGPGLALIGLLGISDPWRELALAIGVGLALDLVVVAVMAYAGNRTSGDALTVLVVVALAGAVAQVALGVRRRNREVTS